MNDARKKMLDKIKAMMNQNGRTEEEVMAFLAKARELMATYGVTEEELKELDKESYTRFSTAPNDPYDIKKGLGENVGKYTTTAPFTAAKDGSVTFAGKESDVIFATWLLDTLQRFVMRALREYQKQRSLKKMTNSNWTSASFVAGCTHRISERLKELAPINWSDSRKLILKEMALATRKTGGKADIHGGSALAGSNAGEYARFDKPVGSGGQKYLK